MAAPKIKANYAQLTEIAQLFQQHAEAVNQQLNAIKHGVEKLSAGDWQGQGASAFYAEMNADIMPAFKRLGNALAQAAQKTLAISQQFSQAEEDAARVLLIQGAVNPHQPDIGEGVKVKSENIAPGKLTTTPHAATFKAFNGPLKNSPDAKEHGFHLNDLQQGLVGDCFLLASLGAIVNKQPDVLENAIQDNKDGTYTVRFYEKIMGASFPIYETVNNLLPVDKNGNLTYAKQGDNGELWPAIVEKAWAQHKGGYNKIDGGNPGQMLEALTGQPSIEKPAADITFDQITQQLDNGGAVIFTTYEDQMFDFGIAKWDIPDQTNIDAKYVDLDDLNRGVSAQGKLVPNHSFVVESADKTAGTVSILNPWGNAFPPIVLTEKEFQESIKFISLNPVKE
ncbi:MAG: WXG100 family type VII secretion target [Anaerolineae bacterium]|nr:WXG100 family type VII secretion target [Anaerolineae bacterium]